MARSPRALSPSSPSEGVSGAATLAPLASPKRNPLREGSRDRWFPYYAGFSVAFVQDVLRSLRLPPNATVLDPWLGSGTTSEVALRNGYRVKGFDLNPAMLLVARARTITKDAAVCLPALAESTSARFQRRVKKSRALTRQIPDPIELWLRGGSARVFRALEDSIAASVRSRGEPRVGSAVWERIDEVPAQLALLYVALFRTFRRRLSGFLASNPAWVKIPEAAARLSLGTEALGRRFRHEVDRLLVSVQGEPGTMRATNRSRCQIACASSLHLPLSPETIDAVISSPPYCTRIDYVRATLPELAIIDYPVGRALGQLREAMIGSPKISRQRLEVDDPAWGPTCSRFLRAVSRHASKASPTYYLQYYRQYFSSAYASLLEIDRVLKVGGSCVLVVQDSFYKEVRNDLARVFLEMAQSLGWRLKAQHDFAVRGTLAGLNPRARKYREHFGATESVLVLTKGSPGRRTATTPARTSGLHQ
jgi:SAM-dependent methyltransferase